MSTDDPKSALASFVPPGRIIGEFELLGYLAQKKTSLRLEQNDPHEKYDFYICHSRRDSLYYAEDLAYTLRHRGYHCFLDEWEWYGSKVSRESVPVREELTSRLEARIKRSAAFILIMGYWTFESDWVRWETQRILKIGKPLYVVTIHPLPWSSYGRFNELLRGRDLRQLRFAKLVEDFSEYSLCILPDEVAKRVAEIVGHMPNVSTEVVTTCFWVERVSESMIQRIVDVYDPRAPVGHQIATGVAFAAVGVFCLFQDSGSWLLIGGCVVLLACPAIVRGIRGRRRGGVHHEALRRHCVRAR